MATQFTSNTLPSSYHDDYDANDHYHQILFNSGRPLQARELTQLQTMMYQELGRLGKNIFKEGAVVNPGGSSINANLDYVTIVSTEAGGDFADIPLGSVFLNPTSGVQAKVIAVAPADGVDQTYNTLYVQYVNAGSSTIGSESTVFADGQTLYEQTGTGYRVITHSTNSTGKGVRFTTGEGDYFVLGRFVRTSEQSIILSPYSKSVSATVGFKVIQEVVSVNDTTDLYDNAAGIINTSSPGADRYRIRLELTTQDKITSDDTFVFLANIENSKIVEEVKPSEAYNQIEELLALRTKEESGNYIVNPFTIHLEDNVSADSNLELVVSSGVAYLNGYRVENPSAIKLSVPRPQETETITNDVVPVVYGNYFLADSGRGMPNLDASSVNLYDTIGGTGSALGTARIRAVQEDGVNVRVHVFDINVDSVSSLQNVKSIGTGTSDYLDLVLTGGKAVLNDTTNNDLLFPTSRPRAESFDDITLVKQTYVSETASGTTVALPTLPTGQSYTDTSLWVASTASNTFETNMSVTLSNGGRNANVTVAQSGAAYELLVYVQKTATVKSKTLTTTETTFTSTTVNGVTYFDLGVPDIYEVTEIRQTNSSGVDLSNIFSLDDGQRDNFYADGRLILEDGQTDPGTIYVSFQHFARGVSGDFYCAASYDVDYTNIPDHTLIDGTVVSLRDFLDFRPDKNDGTFSNIFGLPRTGTNITADISYYLSRADKLLITQEGDIQLLMGQQSLNPQFKPTPNNCLELYKIVLNGNTLDQDDVQVTPIEHKRYTMADIAKIEAKLDKLEEYTTLNFLELESKLSSLLDSDGNIRPECGIQVDDFSDHSRTDTNNPDLSSSIDPESRLVRPKVHEDNVRLVVDNDLSNNIIKKGDNVYLNYTEEEWAKQELASRFVKINPFGLVDNVGTLKLSPSSDEWKESYYEANKALAGSNKVDKVQAFLWNNWMWNWMGRTVEDVHLDYDKLSSSNPRIRTREYLRLREKYASTFTTVPTRTANGRFVSRVVSSDTLREVIGNRTIDVALIPWIRSRKIYFHAKGLKPNTKFTPFFDGQKVTEWCREEAAFVQWSDRTDDIGNQYTQLKYSEHPSGTTELISDENGELIGSFFIPNLRPYYYVERIGKKKKKKPQYRLRFRAGIREFKLLDIDTNDWAASDSKAFAYYSAKGVLWNYWGPILSTRQWQYTVPFAGLNNLGTPSVYTPKELQSALDAVTSANVGIVEPQLSGQYGFNTPFLTTSALTTLDANGEVSQVLSDYINVNQNQSSGTAVSPISMPQNPMAQTFKVDNQFGLTLSKIDLFFRTKDNGNLPVAIHIRPVVNGRPSSTEIVPDSHVFLNPSDVDAVGTNPTLSVIQSRPTTFVFDEPIFLQPWTEYAIVVTSQSTDYELFSAKTTEPVYGSTARMVTTQPAPGSLFLPQNGVFWIESKDQDIMFTMHRAKFDVGAGSLILKNAPLPASLLDENPIYTTSGSSTVYIKHPNHGLIVGDVALIDSAEAVGGIPSATLNGEHAVTDFDVHGYQINVGTNASSTIVGGGDDVLSRRNEVFSVANPYIESIIPNFTSIDVSAKFTSGRSVAGSETRFVKDASYQRITPKQNIDFSTPRAIYSTELETAQLGGDASVYVKIDFKTSNDYVSPVIDMQRASLILANNVIDDPSVRPAIYEVAETEPYGGTAASKHITTPVVLEQSAVGIEVKADVNLPAGSGIDFYYRTCSADENIYDQNWILHNPESNVPNDNDQTYREIRYLPGGQGGVLNPFNQAQTKVVFKGTDVSNSPSLKGLRLKWLAV